MDGQMVFLRTPARRSFKFVAKDHSRNFLAFDSSISKHDRMIFYMGVLVNAEFLIDQESLPCFAVPAYLPGEYTELRVITDRRHPAFGQIGLFAKKPIPSNFVVTPYSGYVEIFGTSCSSRTYTMGYGSINDDYALDAEFAGNYGRFANDPRGIEGATANISAESRVSPRGEIYTALVTRRIINKGEEILMSYGKDHNLTHNPWMGIKGEALTRYRVSSPMPFHFRAKQSYGNERNIAAGVASHTRVAGALPITHPRVSNSQGVKGVVAVAKETQEDPYQLCASNSEAELEFFWECTQCGTWCVRDLSSQMIDFCSFCRSPRVHRARLVAVCCSEPLPPEVLDKSDTPIVSTASECEPIHQTVTGGTPDAEGSVGCSSRFSQSSTDSKEANQDGQIDSGQSRNVNGGCNTQTVGPPAFTSRAIDWPLSVPFLPWQVWDPAVPLRTIIGHTRFDTQDNIFLYSVGTLDEQEREQQSGDEVQQGDNDCGGSSSQHEREQENDIEEGGAGVVGEKRQRRRGRKPRVRRKKEELWIKEAEGVGDVHSRGEDAVAWCSDVADSLTPHDRVLCTDYFFLLPTSLGCSSGEDQTTGAIRVVRNLLNGVSPRVFAGKVYRGGDVVAAVGGLIQMLDDTRGRPDDSVLRIPMKYFLPKKIRDKLKTRPATPDANEAVAHMALVDLLKQFECLELVVTNELMFCPCIALPDGDEGRGAKTSALYPRESGAKETVWNPSPIYGRILELCNINFVLTVDALGCPYVAAVATKDIGAFDPLLARLG